MAALILPDEDAVSVFNSEDEDELIHESDATLLGELGGVYCCFSLNVRMYELNTTGVYFLAKEAPNGRMASVDETGVFSNCSNMEQTAFLDLGEREPKLLLLWLWSELKDITEKDAFEAFCRQMDNEEVTDEEDLRQLTAIKKAWAIRRSFNS